MEEKKMKTFTTKQRINWIAKSGILAAVAIVLMLIELQLPLMPDFLKFDFSEVPVVLAAFALGPVSAIFIELIKNLAHLIIKGPVAFGIGQLSNFLVGCAFVIPAAILYRTYKTKVAAIFAMLVGTLTMVIFASVMNYFVMIPLYEKLMNFPLSVIIKIANVAGNTMVTDLKTLIVFVFVPFNLFKGAVVSFIVALVYKRVSPLLHKEFQRAEKQESFK
jgi:riboflavin transporter FmnP